MPSPGVFRYQYPDVNRHTENYTCLSAGAGHMMTRSWFPLLCVCQTDKRICYGYDSAMHYKQCIMPQKLKQRLSQYRTHTEHVLAWSVMQRFRALSPQRSLSNDLPPSESPAIVSDTLPGCARTPETLNSI